MIFYKTKSRRLGGKKLAKKKANWRHDHAHRKTDYSTIRGVVATADFFTRFDTAPSLIVIQSQRLIFSLLSLWTGWNTESVSRNKTNTGIMSTLQTERAARSFDAQLSNVCDLVKIGSWTWASREADCVTLQYSYRLWRVNLATFYNNTTWRVTKESDCSIYHLRPTNFFFLRDESKRLRNRLN